MLDFYYNYFKKHYFRLKKLGLLSHIESNFGHFDRFFELDSSSLDSKKKNTESNNFLTKKLETKHFDIYIFAKNNNEKFVILELFYDSFNEIIESNFFADSNFGNKDSKNTNFFIESLQDIIISIALSMRFFGHNNIAIIFCKSKLDSKNHKFLEKKYHLVLKQENIIESNIKYSINNNITTKKDIESKTLMNSKKLRKMKNFASVKQIQSLLESRNAVFEGKFCVIVGINENSLHTLKALQILRAKVVAISDSKGFIYEENGLDILSLLQIIGDTNRLFFEKENFLKTYARLHKCEYSKDKLEIFNIPAFAFFLNDFSVKISLEMIENMLKNGCKCVVENALCIDYRLDSKLSNDLDISAKNLVTSKTSITSKTSVTSKNFLTSKNELRKNIDSKAILDSNNALKTNNIFETNTFFDIKEQKSALGYILDSKIIFTPFILTFTNALTPTFNHSDYEKICQNFAKIYDNALQNASELKSPTNLLLGVLDTNILDLKKEKE
ncbi:hypothetical protein [Helicobacter saguini]|nr:hypothetical protein [Helicobacter saguini]MWV69147.1 hypothetical protein [Helicobacter saguini]MWV71298.1 hypothetical protein [Helicobacter saguini]